MKDWRGTVIKVGAKVVYPSRQSSSLWMNEGIVESVEVENGKDRVGVRKTREARFGTSKKTSGSRVAYPDSDRITVVQ